MKSENLSSGTLVEVCRSISRQRYSDVITKEVLEENLFKLVLSQSQIAEKYGCGVDTVQRLQKRYEIEVPFDIRRTTSLKAKRFILEGVDITSRQRSIIVGSILGDANVRKSNNGTGNVQIYFTQCVRRKAYLVWKSNELYPFSRPVTDIPKDKACYFRTMCYCRFNVFYDMFWVEGRKTVPDDIADYLDELALSVFYQDDGHTSKNNSSISTCNFTVAECEILSTAVKHSFSIDSYVKLHYHKKVDKSYPSLHFGSAEHKKLHQLIDPLFHTCFDYKRLG